ncbi:MAG: hypothetical protein RLZZ229_356 [Actinomycetota bacterium]
MLLFFATLASAVWLVAALLKKRDSAVIGKKPMRPWWIRLIAMVTIVPLLLMTSLLIGTGVGLAIKPYSKSEIAENKARAEAEIRQEKLRAAAEKAQREEQAKLDADKAAAEKDAADEQRKRDDAEKAANAAAEAARNKRDSKSESGGSSSASELLPDPFLSAELDKIEKYKGSAPLLYATGYCLATLRGSKINVYDYVSNSSDGTSLFLSTKSGYDVKGTMVYNCLKLQLSFSAALISNIEHTTALAGTQTWSENRMDLQWTYHPSNGINMSIIREKQCFLFLCN